MPVLASTLRGLAEARCALCPIAAHGDHVGVFDKKQCIEALASFAFVWPPGRNWRASASA